MWVFGLSLNYLKFNVSRAYEYVEANYEASTAFDTSICKQCGPGFCGRGNSVFRDAQN
jgi:hypothetical protein